MTIHAYATFDFGLSQEQEDRAARLLSDHPTVDLLYQGPTSPDVFIEEGLGAEDVGATTSDFDGMLKAWVFLLERAMAGEFPRYRELYDASGVTCGTSGFTLSDSASLYQSTLLHQRVRRALPWLRTAETARDVRDAHAAGEHAVYNLSQFNLLRPGDGLKVLEEARDLGLLTVDCAYNVGNFVGTGCTERRDAGLTNFGIRFVKACNDLEVIVDTAHTGKATTIEACEYSTQPVIATHTAAAGVYECDRGKSDEELQAIAGTGGVIGVVAVPFFLAPLDTKPTIQTMLDHIGYIADLVGWQQVAIGTDWPVPLPYEVQEKTLGAVLEEIGFREEHELVYDAALEGFRDYRDWPNIVRGLVARGYDDDRIAGIIGGNFLRVIEDIRGT